MDLKDLGLTQERAREMVIDRIVTQLLSTSEFDIEWEQERLRESALFRALESAMQEAADAKVAALFEEHVAPNVARYVEELTLTKTNKWGEEKEKTLTFIEYLVERAEAYINEDVDYGGKAQKRGDSFGWRKGGTRIAFMVDEHLQYSISAAMKTAVKDVNSQLANGIAETVKAQLAQIVAKLKVEVKTP